MFRWFWISLPFLLLSFLSLPLFFLLFSSCFPSSSTFLSHHGKAVTGDGDSYRYLVESIRQFPPQDEFRAMISDAGETRKEEIERDRKRGREGEREREREREREGERGREERGRIRDLHPSASFSPEI